MPGPSFINEVLGGATEPKAKEPSFIDEILGTTTPGTAASTTGYTADLRAAASALKRALPQISDPAMYAEAAERAASLPPEFQRREMGRLTGARSRLNEMRQAAGQIAGELERGSMIEGSTAVRGLPEEAEALRAARVAQPEIRAAKQAAAAVRHGGSWALGQLNRVSRAGMRLTAPDVPPPPSATGQPPPDPGQWDEWIRRMNVAAESPQGPSGALPAHPVATTVVGAKNALGTGLGLLARGLERLDSPGDYWAMGRPEEATKERIRQGKAVGDFGMAMAADPLSYVSLGGASQAKRAAQVVERAGLGTAPVVAGMSGWGPSYRGAGQAMESLLGREFNPGTIEKARTILRGAGATEPEIAGMIGKQGELLGARQLRVEIPFTGVGFEPIPAITKAISAAGSTALGGPGVGVPLEFPAGKALQAVTGGRALQSLPLATLFGAATRSRFAHDASARMRGMAAIQKEEFLRDAETAISGAPHDPTTMERLVGPNAPVPAVEKRAFWIGPKRRVPNEPEIEKLIDFHLDPSRDLVKLSDLPPGTVSGTTIPITSLSPAAEAQLRYTGKMTSKRRVFGPQQVPELGVANVINYHGEPHAVLVDPATYLFQAQLSPEQRTLDIGLQHLFDKWGQRLVGSGAIESLARNPASGRYFPRTYTLEQGPLDELRAYGPNPKTGPGSPFRHRVDEGIGVSRGQMLEQEGQVGANRRMKQDLDLPEVLQRYAGQQGRAQARAYGYDWLGQNYSDPMMRGATGWSEIAFRDAKGKEAKGWVPNDALNQIEGTFNRTWDKPSNMLRAMGAGNTMIGRGAIQAMRGAEFLGQNFKTNVLTRVPGFHALNTPQDFGQVVGVTGARPDEVARAIEDFAAGRQGADVVINGRTIPGKDFVRQVQEQGLATEALNQADIFGGNTRAEVMRLRRAMAPELGTTLPERGAAALARATLPPKARSTMSIGERYQAEWRPDLEGGAVLAAMRRGNSLEEAVHLGRQGSIDYAGAGPVRQAASNILPFGKFLLTAPGVVAQAATRSPATVLGAGRALGTAASPTPEPPRYARERGPLAPATGLAQALSGAVGAEWPANMPALQLRRWDWAADALAPFENPGQFAQQFSMPVQAAIEAATDTNLQTKAQTPFEWGLLRREGFPNAPEALQTKGIDAKGLLSQRMAPFLMPPLAMMLGNYIQWKRHGGETPGSGTTMSSLGETRPYALEFDPRIQWMLQGLNYLTRNPIYANPPSAEIQNVRYGPDVLEAEKRLEELGKKRRQVQAEVRAQQARESRGR